MNWLNPLDQYIVDYLIGSAGDATGGIVSHIAVSLVNKLSTRLKKRFDEPQIQQELEETLTEALAYAFGQWSISEDTADHLFDLLYGWFEQPVVLDELKKLITTPINLQVDIEILQEEFEEAGLSLLQIGIPFDEFIQDLFAGFYQHAKEQPELRKVLVLANLEATVNEMHALHRLNQRMLEKLDISTVHLANIQTSVNLLSTGNVDTNQILTQILDQVTRFNEQADRPLTEAQQLYQLARHTDVLPQPPKSSPEFDQDLIEQLESTFSLTFSFR